MEITLEEKSAIYYVCSNGDIFSESLIKIPIITDGRKFSGEFKVIKKTKKKLTQIVNNRGYYSVRVNGKTKMVHRLVAEAFIENVHNKPFVNHKDGNKLNNDYSNLEWVTNQENIQHAHDNGLIPMTEKRRFAGRENMRKLSNDDVLYIRKNYKPKDKEHGMSGMANMFGVSKVTIHDVVTFKKFKDVK